MLAFADRSESCRGDHGGDLTAARALFPGAIEPFIDLSTGINPRPYPLPRFSAAMMARLPEAQAMAELGAIAARAYGAPSAACVVPAPGTQILLPLIAGSLPPGNAAIVGPTYSEFARAAALAGHRIVHAHDLVAAVGADLVFVCHPNNPDGRLFTHDNLFALAKGLRRRGGMLVVDEAFMDVGPAGTSLAAETCCGNIVVLRSFGKFFGLAGMRLGFALTAPPFAQRLAAMLGPWAVSAPALATGTKALGDHGWIEKTRAQLAKQARKLDAILIASGLEIVGGTDLFRLARTPAADALFQYLGRAGIFVRAFAEHPDWLRFGLPGRGEAWRRLQTAVARFRSSADPRDH